MKIGEVDVVTTAKETFKDFKEDDLTGLAAEVAYHLLFSVVPLLIFLTALSAFISRQVGVQDTMGSITDWLFDNLPADTARGLLDPIRELINQESGAFLSFGAVAALWGGKNALAALMKSLNVAFDVKETRPWWKKTAIAIGLTIALGVAVIAASTFFLAGSWLGDWTADRLGWGSAWTTIWAFLRWPLIAVLLAAALAFLYWAGPNVDAPFKWLTPGAVVAVLLWAVATFALGIYFQRFAGYAEAYGALGGALAFVFWLYVMSLILLFGGELNSVLARAHDPETQAEVNDPEKRTSGVGAKRQAASGAQADDPPEPAPGTTPFPPPAPLPAFSALAASLPSVERAARATLAAEGAAGRERRFRSAAAALVASAIAAVSAAIVGAGRRG